MSLVQGLKKKTNRGSTTVEMCFVMPIVLFVVAFCMGLFINSIRIVSLFEQAYVKMYSYNVAEFSASSIEKDLKDTFEKESDIDIFVASADGGVIELALTRENKDKEGTFIYNREDLYFNLEYDKCTSRLRRWQLYGDILQR